eukprot:CAMPEP_0202003612 /NCGR_PEP_ID=MMETSP0905-20130828/9147_1 /ASSEMBLY_ACC=CAM_ASM_000554 /TAXON_ID=420261 /ORGANISM="Thalassiosira antarctica, Strain CCMP982" /LENGTH=850 /DNA_ID=CAMNT_0048560781 /DNA_START=93 /DNA_END=2645 /DNA_ORIENTATION=+
MNESNRPFSMTEYTSPERMAATHLDTAHDDDDDDDDVSESSYPHRRRASISSAPLIRHRTLKSRIKRNMASSLTSSATSIASSSYSARSPTTGGGGVSGGKDTREELVFAAASALASLGVTSPTSSFTSRGAVSLSGGGERRKEEHPTTTNNATWGAASVARNAPVDSTLLSGRMLMSSLIRPPPIVAPPSVATQPSQLEIVEAESRLSRLSRPFASLLGSDIPLTFPQKLMEVLSNPDIDDIVTWLPHGKGFIILQKRKFSMDVMPGYFKHSKFTSFTRKLNRWGFSRVGRGPEMGAYYHKFFQRGNYLLCMQMHCQSNNKSTKDTATTTMDTSDSPSPTTSPKHDPKESSSPPLIKTSSNVTSNTMPHLELDAESSSPRPHLSPSPVRAVPNNSDHAPTLPRNNIRSSAQLSNLQHHPSDISTDHSISNNSASSFVVKPSTRTSGHAFGEGTLARFGHDQGHHQGQQQQQQQQQRQQHGLVDNSVGSFDRAFSRQQEILRGASHSSAPTLFRTAHSNNANQGQGQGGSMLPSSLSMPPSSLFMPQLQRQQQLHPRQGRGASPMQQQSSMQPQSSMQQQHRSRRRSNIDQAITIQQLLGVNTSSSRSHPLVIANALKALKSCNDQAFLTALMSKKEQAAKANGSNSMALPHRQQERPYQGQSRVHVAMQAQLRQLEEYSNEHYSRTKMTSALAAATQRGGVTQGSGSGGTGRSVESSTQSVILSAAGVENAMLAQMRQLEESKYQRLIAGQMGSSNTMSQGNVAQLYNEINAMRQQQQQRDSGVSSSVANSNASPLSAEINAMRQQQRRQRGSGLSSSVTNNNVSQVGGAGESRSQRKHSRSVRRASAA